MKSHFDVVIFGAGPAGLATAIALRQHGKSVVVVTREHKFKSTGESLTATAKYSLDRLGLWEIFQQDAHPPCHANSSAWGEEVVRHYSFVQSANGHGWHIDRSLFDKRMLEEVASLGVPVYLSKHHSVAQTPEGNWEIQSADFENTFTAKMAVDATGRNNWFARQLGIKRLKSDDQIALVAFLKTEKTPLSDHSSLVESVENGWWYSALQPDGRLACIYFTDPDLIDNRSISNPLNWKVLVQKSKSTFQRIAQYDYQLDGQPFFRSANSSVLEKMHDRNWLSVGDAAVSYDPLSSHGLSFALISGWDAAQAIHGHLEGVPYLMEHYSLVLQKAFIAYMSERFDYYLLEKRWREFPFWKSRQSEEKQIGFLEGCLEVWGKGIEVR